MFGLKYLPWSSQQQKKTPRTWMDACLLRKIRAFIEAQVGMVAMGLAPSLCVFFWGKHRKKGG
jgi:hypothetical protein